MARLRSLTDAATPVPRQASASEVEVEVQLPAKARGREGKKMVAGWYDKAAVKQLQQLALERETTMQNLVGEALNLLFRQNGLPALARIEEAVTTTRGEPVSGR